jgi:hypothetical protein
MKCLKYIIPEKTNSPILFSSDYNHEDIAKAVGQCSSAGFALIMGREDGKIDVHCFGESLTLNLLSDPVRDEKLILELFRVR